MSATPCYLIRYGRSGFVGRFPCSFAPPRGERVVVRGPRGHEFGEVLAAVPGPGDAGDVLRVATDADESLAAEHEARAYELLSAAVEGACEASLPLAFVDVETTLDGVAILHALPWDACDATALLEGLAARFTLTVRLLDLTRVQVAPEGPGESAHAGCGKPGCGTESGGCSGCGTGGGCTTGSCSKGTVKSADELTAHFSDLRRRMEAAGLARTPLN